MRYLRLPITVILLVCLMAGGGLFAHFTDTEQSTPNSFQAGSVDLLLSNTGNLDDFHDGVSMTWTLTGWEPDTDYTATLYMMNAGSGGAITARIQGTELEEEDNGYGEPEGAGSLNNLADYIKVKSIVYTEAGEEMGGAGVAEWFAGHFGDNVAPLTLRELCTTPYHMIYWVGNGEPGESGDYFAPFEEPPEGPHIEHMYITFEFNEEGEEINWLQSDTATFTITVEASDDASYIEKADGCFGIN